MRNTLIVIIMAAIFPSREGDLLNWLANFISKVLAQGLALALPPGVAADRKMKAEALKAKIEEVRQKKQDWRESVNQKNTLMKSTSTEFSNDFKNWKTLPAYNDGIGQDLGIISPPEEFDEHTYKPNISVNMEGGRPHIHFLKSKSDGGNVYSRLRGESNWNLLSLEIHPPYVDTRPLHQPGVPEEREYMVQAVKHDELIGQPSEVESIVLGVQPMA